MTKFGKYEYERCSIKQKCPICGKDKWCMVSVDGQFALCTKIQDGSIKTWKAGYLHKLGEPIKVKVDTRPPIRQPSQYVHAVYNLLDKSISALEPLALSLGVQPAALHLLGCGRFRDKPAWGFPMYNTKAEIVGIKCRSVNRKKWCVRGSRLGLYLPWAVMNSQRIIVTEGESDCAAALTIGMPAIGRPDVNSCHNELLELVNGKEVYLAVDNDADGKGLLQAGKLAEMMTPKAKLLINPKYKDLREWILSGEKIVLEPFSEPVVA